MASSASTFDYNPEFDGFLFATVGEDKKGMALSVVSALARLNVDPWVEAAALRDLPKEAATRRLASLISQLPVEQSGKLDEGTIAARLIALLPSKRGPVSTAHEGDLGRATTDPRIAMFGVLGMSMLVAIFLSMHHQTPSQAHHPTSAVSGAVSPMASDRAHPATTAAKKNLE